MIGTVAFAQPNQATIVAGQATITRGGGATTITQATDKSIINWQGFSTKPGESVTFVQPGQGSVTLNRVTGGQASSLKGALSANGQVVLVIPDGVYFGPTARVDVNGLVATTSDIANGDFMAGRSRFGQGTSNPNARVVNRGTITVDQGGYAVLSAAAVENTGTVTAKLGTIVLGAAKGFTLDLAGDGLLTYQVTAPVDKPPAKASALVANSGTLDAAGGTILLTARAARSVTQSAINLSGVVRATGIRRDGGSIIIDGGVQGATAAATAPESRVTLSGTVDAGTMIAGGVGGRITTTGDHIALTPTATITASGPAGGGTILLGGDKHGGGATPVAKTVTVAKGASVAADGSMNGAGGTVVIFSNDASDFSAAISAKGGPKGGDGGWVEVSGKAWLAFAGRVDTSAPLGVTGSLLLDPADVTIVAGASNAGVTSVAGSYAPAGTPATIGAADLVANLAGTAITVDASSGTGAGPGKITVLSGGAITYAGANNLTLKAASDISIGGAIGFTGNAGLTLVSSGGAIAIGAGIALAGTGALSITANNASVGIATGGTPSTAAVVVMNGVHVTTAAGALTIMGASKGTAPGPGLYLGSLSAVATTSGAMSLTGNGSATAAGTNISSFGVLLAEGGGVSTGGSGSITITGTGGKATGTGSSSGVAIQGVVSTLGAGSIAITGTAGPGGSGTPLGIAVYSDAATGSGQISSVGGAIALNGHAALVTGGRGVEIFAAATFPSAKITTSTGDISIIGDGDSLAGVRLDMASVVSATGGGGITLSGTSTSTLGIALNIIAGSTVSAALGGNISLGANGRALQIDSATVKVTDGALSITASGSIGAELTAASITATGTGSIALSVSDLSIDTGSSVSTNGGAMTISPDLSTATVSIGAVVSGNLSLSQAILNRFGGGPLTLSGAGVDLGGTVTLIGAATLTATTGSITNTGGLSAAIHAAALTLGAAAGSIAAPFVTPSVNASGLGDLSLTSTAASGAVTINAASASGNIVVKATAQALVIASPTSFAAGGGSVSLTSNTDVTIAGAVSLAANTSLAISTPTGAIAILAPVTLAGSDALSAVAGGRAGLAYGISVAAAGSVATAGGALTLTGHALTSAATGIGVSVAGALTSATGLIKITGTGASNASINNNGVVEAATGTISSTGGGSITIGGTGGSNSAATQGAMGVMVIGHVTALLAGAISITGHGTGGASGNMGVNVTGGAVVSSATGSLSINGTAAPGTGGSNYGVQIHGVGTKVISAGGVVAILGVGAVGNDGGYGALITTGALVSAGTGGSLTITGTSGTTTGLYAVGAQINGATVTGAGGAPVTINGAGVGGANWGVNLTAGASVSTDAGSLTIIGTGIGAGNGVDMSGSGQTNLVASGSGALVVKGTAGAGGFGLKLESGVTNIIGGTGQSGGVSLATDSLKIVSGAISSTGAVTIAPLTAGDSIGVGSGNAIIGGLQISSAALAAVTGASLLTIGSATAGAIDLGTATSGVRLAILGGATLTNSGDFSATGASLSLTAPNGITQTTGAISAAALAASSSGGAVSLIGGSNMIGAFAGGGAGSIGLKTGGAIVIGAVAGVAGVTSGGAVSLAATGDLTIAQAISVGGGSLVIVAGAGQGQGVATGGDIVVTGGSVAASGGVTLYTGGVGGSAGTAALAGPGGYRYDSTPTATGYDAVAKPLSPTGVSVIYREQPVFTATLSLSTGATLTSRTYDGTTTTASVTSVGAVNGDATLVTVSGGPAKNVGSYSFAASGASPADLGYAYTPPPPMSYTVDAATLTYTANPATAVFGAAIPALSGTITGFVGGETQTGATTGSLVFTTTATATGAAGNYVLTGGGLAANNGNYIFAQGVGNALAFTITPAPPQPPTLSPPVSPVAPTVILAVDPSVAPPMVTTLPITPLTVTAPPMTVALPPPPRAPPTASFVTPPPPVLLIPVAPATQSLPQLQAVTSGRAPANPNEATGGPTFLGGFGGNALLSVSSAPTVPDAATGSVARALALGGVGAGSLQPGVDSLSEPEASVLVPGALVYQPGRQSIPNFGTRGISDDVSVLGDAALW